MNNKNCCIFVLYLNKQKMMTNYEVLSPDGFTIEFERPYYPSREKSLEAFHDWKERFRKQGYYSSNNGRIPLDELENHCKIQMV